MDFDGAEPAPKADVATSPPTGTSKVRTGPPTLPATPVRNDPSRPWGHSAGELRPVTRDAPPSDGRPRRRGWVRRWAVRVAKLALVAIAGILALMLVFRVVDPPRTPVMIVNSLMGEPVDQRWVPLERISPQLLRAVVTSEDARFCRHNGVDLGALQAAINDIRKGRPRGGSTITMQVVKNLFLWPSRSYLRKALEIPLAFALDFVWSKQRIMEVYLNIAEWGPGIYGAEAAARHAFGRSARGLTMSEAARLAVSLPNPAERDAGEPDDTVERLAARVEGRMRAGVAMECLR